MLTFWDPPYIFFCSANTTLFQLLRFDNIFGYLLWITLFSSFKNNSSGDGEDVLGELVYQAHVISISFKCINWVGLIHTPVKYQGSHLESTFPSIISSKLQTSSSVKFLHVYLFTCIYYFALLFINVAITFYFLLSWITKFSKKQRPQNKQQQPPNRNQSFQWLKVKGWFCSPSCPSATYFQ